jgi:hypothetical protein
MSVTQPIGPLRVKFSDGTFSTITINNDTCTLTGRASGPCSLAADGVFSMTYDSGSVTLAGTFSSNTLLSNGTMTVSDVASGTWTADLAGGGDLPFKVNGSAAGTCRLEGDPPLSLKATFTFTNGDSFSSEVIRLTGAIQDVISCHGYGSVDGTFVHNQNGSGHLIKPPKRSSDSWEASSDR